MLQFSYSTLFIFYIKKYLNYRKPSWPSWRNGTECCCKREVVGSIPIQGNYFLAYKGLVVFHHCACSVLNIVWILVNRVFNTKFPLPIRSYTRNIFVIYLHYKCIQLHRFIIQQINLQDDGSWIAFLR